MSGVVGGGPGLTTPDADVAGPSCEKLRTDSNASEWPESKTEGTGASWAQECRGKGMPGSAGSGASKLEPTRATPDTNEDEAGLPRDCSSVEKSARAKESTNAADSARERLRGGKDEPRIALLITKSGKTDPARDKPGTEAGLPRHADCCRVVAGPSVEKSSAITAEPRHANDCSSIADPGSAKSSTGDREPALAQPEVASRGSSLAKL